MSTKTNLKRVALVVVSALGLSFLSTSVVVADTRQAAITNDGGAEYVTSIGVTTNYAPVAGATGTAVEHTVYFKTSTATVASTNYNPSVVLASKPSTSALAEQTRGSYAASVPANKWQFATSSGGTTESMAAGRAINTVTAAVNGTYAYNAQYLGVYYDVAGTYKWTFWNDLNGNGRVDGPEFSYTHSVVVAAESAGQALKATVSAQNSSSIKKSGSTYGQYGSLVKITLTDSAGNPANVDASGGIKVSISGSGKVAWVNGTDVTDAATYTLGQNDFDGSGRAWVNIIDATAETVALTLTGTGSAGNFTAPSALNLTFSTSQTTDTDFAATTTTTTNDVDEHVWKTAGVATTAYFKTGGTTASVYDQAKICDSSGKITGEGLATTLCYDLRVAQDSTSGATNPGSFSVTAAFTADSQTYTITINGGSAGTVTSAVAALDDFVLSSPTVASWRSATGGTQTVTVEANDQFGGTMSNVSVTGSIAGRNATVNVSSKVTDASGLATLSYTDASTSTSSMTDTFTLSSGSVTEVVTITYTSAAGLGASTIALTHAQETTAGTRVSPLVKYDISAGDGAEAGTQTVTATVKDADGVTISGVPVTFSVAGTGAAILSTKATVYTGATGTASTSVYAWLNGTYVVTATAGSVSDTTDVVFAQKTNTEVRTISATAVDGLITVTAKDRFGNVVPDVPLKATRSGTGTFAGSSSATGTTDSNGQAEFIFTGTGTVTIAPNPSDSSDPTVYGQTDAGAGLIDGVDATNTFTDYAAGTSLVAEEGVGSTYSAAGINSVSLSVTGVDAAAAAAEAASDAALEAIDAANAATDAANLAAEAADAATVAAEEARDAADAATAAVEALASEVATLMAALKAQITTLAKTVAKIAKKVKA